MTRLRPVLLRRHWPRALVALAATGAALLSAARAPEVGASGGIPREWRPESPRLPARRPAPVNVRIQGINDLHGHLEPTGQPGGGRAGGVAWLAAWMDRVSGDHTGERIPPIRVAAGDTAGASPLISARFRDEPAIEALGRMRFDVATIGNHELDAGRDEMLRLVRGGDGFAGAGFPYIAANTLDAADGELVLPPYAIVERGGVRVGFIGVTTRASGRWLLPQHAQEVRFDDLSDSVNRWVPELQARGVEAIVVLAHAGGAQETERTAAGEVVDEAREMSDAVDVVVAGHTHTLMNLRVGGKLVTQALSFGTAFDDIRLTIDPATGEVLDSGARIVRTWNRGVQPDPELERLVDDYRARLGDLATRAIADLPAPVTRGPGADGRSPLGTLVADAQRAAVHADIALVPRDWIRADLPAGRVTYADLFDVQPFGDALVRMDMKGSDLREVLEQEPRLESSGVPDDIDADARYSVVANEFLASGGEGYDAFTHGTDRRRMATDIDALADYLRRSETLRARSR